MNPGRFSLGEHETWLWLEVRRLRCSDCEAIRGEGFEFVAPYPRVTKRMARYIAGVCRMLSVAEVARHRR